jgi:predicted ArsR family transcriptional regulator
MERNEISLHEVKVFAALNRREGRWATSKEIAGEAGVAGRTARAHLLKLVRLGIADQAEVFPAHRYRRAEKAAKRNAGYHLRLLAACEVFSVEPGAKA